MLESMAGFIRHGTTGIRLNDGIYANSENRALFVTDSDGVVRHAEAEAQRLLMMALNPRLSPKSGIRSLRGPVAEVTHLCRVLRATAIGKIGQPPPVLRLRNAWGEFILCAYWLGSTDGIEQTRQIGITIERRMPRAVALLRHIEGLPLTVREKQFCLLLTRPLSSNDIAEEMGVAMTTFITHQRNIYAKLGVSRRTELITILQAPPLALNAPEPVGGVA
jgi:DNA-binding CsgD family transcriptional regulator